MPKYIPVSLKPAEHETITSIQNQFVRLGLPRPSKRQVIAMALQKALRAPDVMEAADAE